MSKSHKVKDSDYKPIVGKRLDLDIIKGMKPKWTIDQLGERLEKLATEMHTGFAVVKNRLDKVENTLNRVIELNNLKH